jgi:hypothetical protein
VVVGVVVLLVVGMVVVVEEVVVVVAGNPLKTTQHLDTLHRCRISRNHDQCSLINPMYLNLGNEPHYIWLLE